MAIALIGLTYSELVSAMPRAGGEHVYTHRGLGIGASFCCTWALLLAYVNVCLFEAVALPTAVEYLLPGYSHRHLVEHFRLRCGSRIRAHRCGDRRLIITIINVLGIKPAARFQNIALVLILLAGVLLLTGAIGTGSIDNARPWIATPATGMLSVLIMVPALLVGFDVIPQSAEEINLPPARIGMLLVISVFLAVAWYGMISFAVAMAMPPAAARASSMATGDAATRLWGHPAAGSILVLGGVAGILTSWNAFVIGGSRVLFALAESGLVPAAFARLHPKYQHTLCRHHRHRRAVLSVAAVRSHGAGVADRRRRAGHHGRLPVRTACLSRAAQTRTRSAQTFPGQSPAGSWGSAGSCWQSR